MGQHVDKKSFFFGILFGFVIILSIFYLLGNIKTEFIFNIGKEKKTSISNDIEETLEKNIINGQELTNVMVYSSGDVSREDIDEELERLYNQYNIDKNNKNLNIKIKVNN